MEPTVSGQILIETEKMEVGGVKWGVYSYYFRSVGFWACLVALIFYLAFQGFQVAKVNPIIPTLRLVAAYGCQSGLTILLQGDGS